MTRAATGILMAAALLSACTAVAPAFDVDRERRIAASERLVWEGLMDYMTRNGIEIKTLERDSGVVYAEKMYGGPDDLGGLAHCPEKWHVLAAGRTTAAFNVLVADVDDLEIYSQLDLGTTMAVNTRFSRQVYAFPGFWGTQTCDSTGVLEHAVFEHVAQYAADLQSRRPDLSGAWQSRPPRPFSPLH